MSTLKDRSNHLREAILLALRDGAAAPPSGVRIAAMTKGRELEAQMQLDELTGVICDLAEVSFGRGLVALMGEVFAGVGCSVADREWQERLLQLIDRLLLLRRLSADRVRGHGGRTPCRTATQSSAG